MKENIKKILDISDKTYYNWKNQNRPIIELLHKYFQDNEITEFLETGRISRLEDNKDQELLNNEASKIYNHFISVLYSKDKSLLRLFLVVINNANETSANLNLNFIDLVLEAEGNKKDKINLLKEFSKISQSSNILFFYSIKFMIQNKFENILYAFGDNKIAKDLSFIVNYIQFFLEIFYKKDYIKWQEFEKNESIHLRDYEFNLDDEIFLDEQSDSPLPSLDDLSDENKIPNYDYDDYYNEYEEESNNYDNFNYFKFIDSLKNYKTYLESLIPENDTILVKFKIDENPDIDLGELLTIKNSFDI
ncbi:hypothetical protein HOO34_02465 [Aliarcobacter cryaerophilus]|uniref:Uncharacterized protein n=1 Tax=Aliarcobacter cryaerophilus TaxID=28198 RepID=A0A7G9LPR4_9BACT|nr:hypothetical protein [Aliarcobacter cryaerophilus]QNM90613.1 hypothetical protein HOO34_02465 [Aliarcobacter cryaerophilus]